MLRETVIKLKRNYTIKNMEQRNWRIKAIANTEGSTQTYEEVRKKENKLTNE
jgi:hypothetical protein